MGSGSASGPGSGSRSALDLALDLDLDRAQELVQGLSQANSLAQGQTLSHELTQILEQAQTRLRSPLILLIISIELEHEYGFQLYQGNTLDSFVSQEPDRARTVLTSGVLLASSLLILVALMLMLSKLQMSYGLASNSHLVAFLPEECVAELGVLQRCMTKKNAPTWEIRLRLLQEFLILLWVFYVQVKFENLGLPSDRSADD